MVAWIENMDAIPPQHMFCKTTDPKTQANSNMVIQNHGASLLSIDAFMPLIGSHQSHHHVY